MNLYRLVWCIGPIKRYTEAGKRPAWGVLWPQSVLNMQVQERVLHRWWKLVPMYSINTETWEKVYLLKLIFFKRKQKHLATSTSLYVKRGELKGDLELHKYWNKTNMTNDIILRCFGDTTKMWVQTDCRITVVSAFAKRTMTSWDVSFVSAVELFC